jgi:hypothetical protein
MPHASAFLLPFSIVLATSAPAFQPCTPEWSALGPALPHKTPFLGALEVYDDGYGPSLYVGGRFLAELGAPATGIARWDGSGWSSVGGGGIDGDFITPATVHLTFDVHAA